MIGKAPYVGFLSSRDIDAAMVRHGLEIVESEAMGKGVVTRFLVARKV